MKRNPTFVLGEGSKKDVGRTGEGGGAEWPEYEADMWECLSRREVRMGIQKAVRKILHRYRSVGCALDAVVDVSSVCADG